MSALSELLVRAKTGRSIDAIAEQAKQQGHPINRATVARYLAGDHGPRPAEATLLALASGMGVDIRLLRQCVGAPSGELGPYRPVAESARLSPAQRTAIDHLIKAIVARAEGVLFGSAGADLLIDPVKGADLPGVLPRNGARTAAEAFGGEVYVGEPASAELRDEGRALPRRSRNV